MPALLFLGSILIPMAFGLQVLLIPSPVMRRTAIFLNTAIMAALSIGLVSVGPFQLELTGTFGHIIEIFIVLLDLVILGYMAYLGWRWHKPLVLLLSIAQMAIFAWLELAFPANVFDDILVDRLALTLNLIITFIGSLVIIFATRYMDDLEADADTPNHGLPRFFAVMLIFLGAMNGLVGTDNLRWIYFFWEVTTLSSYLLISHYKHREATENSLRALWMNQVGGLAILVALLVMGWSVHSSSLARLVQGAQSDPRLLLPVGLLVLAAFTKAAQVPFHGWLLGAMVAPTPVSALLHSSTMVNAALYLVFRLSPALRGTTLGSVAALLGAFSFLATSAMAIGEENAKRVLAFSTIANLGLALTMGALDTPLALTAGLLLLVYHAVSKGLLFLAVGNIEHHIGSRHIEKMDRLFETLPITTLIAVTGMISMMMPPFGVLVGKWLAIEASVDYPLILPLIIFGSAFTVVFWSKWVGRILATSCRECGPLIEIETLPLVTGLPLYLLVGGVVLSSLFLGAVFDFFVRPVVLSQFGRLPLTSEAGGLVSPVGGFFPWPLFLVLLLVLASIPFVLARRRARNIRCPYMCGENTGDECGSGFVSARDQTFTATVGNYYAESVFGEGAVNRWAVPVSIGLILVLLGVTL